ncbi:MAG: hypothetical protein EXR93_08915 [Gemmatimonadetes bacterium]|nr:hypothetical protein [Gemmatimonadota bacterium]
MNRALAFTFIAVLIAAPLAADQETPSLLEPGARVRLTSCLGPVLWNCRWSGTVSSWNRDSVLVRPEGRDATVRLPAASLTRIELSRGRVGHAGHGALIGFIPGLLLMASSAVSWPEDFEPPLTTDLCAKACDVTTSFGFAVFGGALGALIGSAVKTEQWESLPLPLPR